MKAKLEWNVKEPERLHGEHNTKLEVDFDTIASVFKNAVIDKEYYDYIRDKKVVIVGPAGYLRGQNRGDFFTDNFDIIVRINRSFPLEKTDWTDLGYRTDIRYHNGSENPVEGGPLFLERSSNLEYLSVIFPRHLDYFDHHINEIERKINESDEEVKPKLHTYTDIEQFITFHHIMKTRPNAGVATILDLLNYSPKQLHISGMTFFTGKSYIDSYSEKALKGEEHHVKRQMTNHAQGPQRDLVRMLYENYSTITLDDEVKETLGVKG